MAFVNNRYLSVLLELKSDCELERFISSKLIKSEVAFIKEQLEKPKMELGSKRIIVSDHEVSLIILHL